MDEFLPPVRITHQSIGQGLSLNYRDIRSSQSPDENNAPECKIKIWDHSSYYSRELSIRIVITLGLYTRIIRQNTRLRVVNHVGWAPSAKVFISPEGWIFIISPGGVVFNVILQRGWLLMIITRRGSQVFTNLHLITPLQGLLHSISCRIKIFMRIIAP